MTTAHTNPFRVERIEKLSYRMPGFSWDELLRRFESMAYRGALVGPHGSGKTTMLLELKQRIEDSGLRTEYHLLNAERPRLPRPLFARWSKELDQTTVMILDGAEQLGPLAWRKFLRATRGARGLVITCHKPGRLAALHHCRAREDVLDSLLDELLDDRADAFREKAHLLFHECGGNVRNVFFSLYDLCAGR